MNGDSGVDFESLRALASVGSIEVVLGVSYGAAQSGPGVEVLEVFVGRGWVSRQVTGNDFICSACASSDLVTVERCRGCSSIDIESTPLVHHLECAGVFPLVGTVGGAVGCPKCGAAYAPERAVFERCGMSHHCYACGIDQPETHVEFRCKGCGHATAASEAQKRKMVRYTITPAGEAAAEGGPK